MRHCGSGLSKGLLHQGESMKILVAVDGGVYTKRMVAYICLLYTSRCV